MKKAAAAWRGKPAAYRASHSYTSFVSKYLGGSGTVKKKKTKRTPVRKTRTRTTKRKTVRKVAKKKTKRRKASTKGIFGLPKKGILGAKIGMGTIGLGIAGLVGATAAEKFFPQYGKIGQAAAGFATGGPPGAIAGYFKNELLGMIPGTVGTTSSTKTPVGGFST